MSDVPEIALAGMSGYGASYLNALLARLPEGRFRLIGCVDPYPERSVHLDALERLGIPHYTSLAELFARTRVDLTMLVTPIQYHADQICYAVEHGSNVLCEKPLAATVEDGVRAVLADGQAGRFVAIGYQWSFSRAIQEMKRDLLRGLFGRPLRFRSLALYPRGHAYYRRNAWAGRQRTDSGTAIFDSPVNNATAHFLHNMLYVLGPAQTSSAWPADVQAELYRANRIESFDTAVLRCRTTCGVEVVFATSHATPNRVGPCFRLECEKGIVTYGEQEPADEVIARLNDGREIRYGRPEADRSEKLWQCISATRRGGVVACDARAALPQTICVHAAHASMEKIETINGQHVGQVPLDGGVMTIVHGLEDVLRQCYEQGRLPSEMSGVAWARPARVVQVPPAPVLLGRVQVEAKVAKIPSKIDLAAASAMT